jgi:hypothetical protein
VSCVANESKWRDADARTYAKAGPPARLGAKPFPLSGRVKGKPKGAKLPYHLPELIAAPVTTTVYFCEGEKDADTLIKLGFVVRGRKGPLEP